MYYKQTAETTEVNTHEITLLTLVWFSTLLRWLSKLLNCTVPKIRLNSIAMKLVILKSRHTLHRSTLLKSTALSHCGPDLSLCAGRSALGRFILPEQITAPTTPAHLAVVDEFILRKIKVFSFHYYSLSGTPPGEISFHFSPYSG